MSLNTTIEEKKTTKSRGLYLKPKMINVYELLNSELAHLLSPSTQIARDELGTRFFFRLQESFVALSTIAIEAKVHTVTMYKWERVLFSIDESIEKCLTISGPKTARHAFRVNNKKTEENTKKKIGKKFHEIKTDPNVEMKNRRHVERL